MPYKTGRSSSGLFFPSVHYLHVQSGKKKSLRNIMSAKVVRMSRVCFPLHTLVIWKRWVLLTWKQTAINKLVYIISSNSGYRVDVISIVTRNICSIQVRDSPIYLYYQGLYWTKKPQLLSQKITLRIYQCFTSFSRLVTPKQGHGMPFSFISCSLSSTALRTQSHALVSRSSVITHSNNGSWHENPAVGCLGTAHRGRRMQRLHQLCLS